MKRSRWYARRWAALGALLSIGAPTGLWVVGQIAEQAAPPWAYVYTGLSTFAVFVAFGWFAGRLADGKEELSIRDRLTGLHNRRYLMDALPRLRALTTRRGESLAMMILDLDRFKRVNDQYGHSIGDRTLAAVANALSESLRDADLVTRYGGEEFVVAATGADRQRAAEMGERVRAAVEAIGPAALGYPGPQTISVGIACSYTTDATTLLEQADAALYRAKESGRNRVVVADPEPGDAPRAPAESITNRVMMSLVR